MLALLLCLLILGPAFVAAYRRRWVSINRLLASIVATVSVFAAAAMMWNPLPDAAILIGASAVASLGAFTLGMRFELINALRQTRELALTDELTGIPNRRAAREFLNVAFGAAMRGRDIAVVLFDLDLFKEYNDRLGHQLGDEALKAFAEALTAETRRMDLCARYGGEEFVAVLAVGEVDDVLSFVDRVRARLAQLERVPRFTVSAGVAFYRKGMENPDELLGAADGALYEAKHQGRDECRVAGVAAAAGSHGVHLANASVDAQSWLHPGRDAAAEMPHESKTVLSDPPLLDPLTRLHNRAGLLRRLQRSLDRAAHQPSGRFSILLLDLDQFKLVNGSLGRDAGDDLLEGVARRLEYCVRPEDMVARVAGDEFVILLNKTADPADSARVAERVLASFGKAFHVGGTQVFVSGAVGVVGSDGYSTAEEMLRDAALANAAAKLTGRSGYRLFDSALHESAVARLKLETELRRGLDAGEFVLHYQPLVRLRDHRVCGVEALVRWQHPERGLLFPSDFLHVVEQMGLIVPLGRAMLRQAVEGVGQWATEIPEHPDLYVSVNVSAPEFADAGLEEHVASLLGSIGVDARRLRLELTEGALMEDFDAGVARIERLRALGVLTMIDDFGSGYSSLSYVHRLPVHSVKIDRSFVAELTNGGRAEALLRTVVALSTTLELEVIAEGIETPEHSRIVETVGCAVGQGHLFCRPLAPEAVGELIRKGSAAPRRSRRLMHAQEAPAC